jgi:hypothetical protein
MLEWVFSWEVTSVVASILIGAAFSFLALDDFKLAKLCFLIAAADAIGGMVMWGVKTQVPPWTRIAIVFFGVGLVGVLAVQALRYVDQKREKKEQPKGPARRITLEQLFKSDFSYTLKASETANVVLRSGFKAKIPYYVYFDFQGKSEFVGFYIAHSPKTFDLCVGLPNLVPKVREYIRKSVEVQSAQAGQQTSLSDLTFTGRVFVYHEDFMTLEQMVELRKIFTQSNMSVEFRGPDYLAAHIPPSAP